MQHKLIQSVGITLTVLFAVFIVWVYATEPRNLKEVSAGVQAATVGYEADRTWFDAGLDLFHRKQYRAARVEWEGADEGKRDPVTQFYIAYSFYREGWHPFTPDADLYRKGLDAVNLALQLKTDEPLKVADPDLKMHTAAELKAEMEKGLERSFFSSLFEYMSEPK